VNFSSRWPAEVEKTRHRVLLRAGFRCERCGKPADRTDSIWCGLIIHHRQRRYQGGSDAEENLEAVCEDCHRAEHHEERHNHWGKSWKRMDTRHTKMVRLRDEDLARLERLAEMLDRSEAGVLREGLRELMKREGLE
jgi:5-methylcytosine-specific restriction endonuclease McrA